MILRYVVYFFLAYLAGGIMFGALIPKVFCGLDIREISSDGNPGTGVTYLCWLVSSILCGIHPVFGTGTFLISAIVLDKHKEELRHLENREVKFIFRRN